MKEYPILFFLQIQKFITQFVGRKVERPICIWTADN